MKRNLLMLSGSAIFSILAHVSPACAQWPTLDLSEVFNTIQSTVSQVQSQISTTMETYSIANIQQAIGDKLGGLQKIKNAQEKAKKVQEKIEKAKKRAEKVVELKKKYEQAAKDAIDTAKSTYDTAQGYVENAKNQVEGTIGNVKNQVENAKNQVEGTIGNVKNQVENAKNQVEGAIGNVKNQVEGVRNQVENTVNSVTNQTNNLFGGSEDNFDFEKTPGNFGVNNGGQVNNAGYSVNSGEVEWGNGFGFAEESTLGTQSDNGFGFVEESTLGAQSVDAFSSVEKTKADVQPNIGFSRSEINGKGSQDSFRDVDVTKEIIEIEWGDADEAVEKGTDDLPNKVLIKDIKDENVGLRGVSEKGLLLKVRDDENNRLEVIEKIKDAEPSAGRTQVKAFGKVSFNYNSKAGYASQGSDFKTGTDNDGNFYFPDAFATWADLNFDDTADEEKLWAAIDKICEDLQSAENRETAEIDRKFDYDVVGVMRANAQAHSAVIENEAENGKTVEELNDMVSVAGGTTLTQDSGMGEIGSGQIHQNRQDIMRLSDEVMSRFFDEVRKYCYHWPETEE